MNQQITAKERGLIKGAIRRVFSRSDLHNQVIKDSIIQHTDLSRPRVKTWCKCNVCGKPDAKSSMVVDHIEPVIPTSTTLELMTWDEIINRIWCVKNNLQSICDSCHTVKTKEERLLRNKSRKERKPK